MLTLKQPRRQRAQRGLGLVELMIGITIGLIITGAASLVAVNQITEHRRLMLETQIQQDLRTAADLIHHDLRRAGSRGLTGLGVWAPASGVGSAQEVPAQEARPNAFSDIKISEDRQRIEYSYTRLPKGTPSDAPSDTDRFAIGWNSDTGVLYFQIGDGGRQPVTDPDTVKITNFQVNETAEDISLADFCDQPCGTGCTPPTQRVRRIDITLQGEAKHDPRVVRTVNITERVRAHHYSGSCPS